MNIGVLSSHEGTTLQALIDACAVGEIRANVAIVISNNSDSGALRRASSAGIPTAHLSGSTHPDPEALDLAVLKELEEHDVDLVVLAGYMKKVGQHTLSAFQSRILNTHPALLPKFGGQGMYGMHVHEAVLAAKEKVSGASVFVVTDDYDTGPVLDQAEVAVMDSDSPESLAARVQKAEHMLLTNVIRKMAEASPSE